jgi:hypothetical protein
MAATDAFEWYVASSLRDTPPEIQKFIIEQRLLLLTLRSEDERQRSVERFIAEVEEMMKGRSL